MTAPTHFAEDQVTAIAAQADFVRLRRRLFNLAEAANNGTELLPADHGYAMTARTSARKAARLNVPEIEGIKEWVR